MIPSSRKSTTKEATENFNKFTPTVELQGEKLEPSKVRSPNLSQLTSQPIVEWFRMFLQAINDKQMLGQLRENIKFVVKDGATREGLIFANLLEIHSRWVLKKNKRKGREFWIDAKIVGF